MKKLLLLLSISFFLFGQANSQDYSLKTQVLNKGKSIYKVIKNKEKKYVQAGGTEYAITQRKKEFFCFEGNGEIISISLGKKDKSVSQEKRWEVFWAIYLPKYTNYMRGWLLYYNGEYYTSDWIHGSIIEEFDKTMKYRLATPEEKENLKSIITEITDNSSIK